MCIVRFEKKTWKKHIGKENVVYLNVQKITLTYKTFKRIIVMVVLVNVLLPCNQIICLNKDKSCSCMLQNLAA